MLGTRAGKGEAAGDLMIGLVPGSTARRNSAGDWASLTKHDLNIAATAGRPLREP